MNKKTYLLAVVVIVFALLLSGCKLSKSTPPPSGFADQTEFPVGVSANLTEIALTTQQVAGQTPQVINPSAPTATPVVVVPQAPVAPTATPYTVPTLVRPATYTLQKGEWPICVARRYNLDLNSFFSVNGLNMNSLPNTGTVLKIPATGTWSSGDLALKAHPVAYTVKSGETIYSIACAFGNVSPEAIIAVNGLTGSYTLSVGQVLQIP